MGVVAVKEKATSTGFQNWPGVFNDCA